MSDCFLGFKNNCDSFATFGMNVSYFWDEGKVFMVTPLEFNYLCRIVSNRKVQSFFFFDDTIAKINFILFF